MYTFSKLLKTIRSESGLKQAQLAKLLGVSTILITMVETGSKEPSKKLVNKLAYLLDVHPVVLMPFLADVDKDGLRAMSFLERQLIDFGEQLQNDLIKKKAKTLVNLSD